MGLLRALSASHRHRSSSGSSGCSRPKCSLVLTNVRGPAEPVSLAGVRVAGVIPWVPAAGTIGMGVNIFSYDGGLPWACESPQG